MLRTEEEAKWCWCPFARELVDDHALDGGTLIYGSVNRTTDEGGRVVVPSGSLCIASGCMAWRWGGNPISGVGAADRLLGFCGLAGKP